MRFMLLVPMWRRVRRLARRLWVRVTLISLLAFVALALAKIFGRAIPEGAADLVGSDALDRLLSIISNSMLTATTFSLSVMVSVHRAVSGQWTPRAHRVMLDDTTTQTVLSTFIGAYIYSLTATVLTSTTYFGEDDRVVLFAMTVVVIILIVAVLLRWILKLETRGSLGDTVKRLEVVARQVLSDRLTYPCLGATPWDGTPPPIPTVDITSDKAGIVGAIFQDRLQSWADEEEREVWIEVAVGQFVMPGAVLARVSGEGEPPRTPAGAFHITGSRNADQDPSFAVTQIAEIGAKALSPGVNDPGTAIDVIYRLAGVFADVEDLKEDDEPHLPRVFMRPLAADPLLRAGFEPLIRYAGGALEVHTALQISLRGLASAPCAEIADAATALAREALDRAEQALPFGPDVERLREMAPG